MPHPRRALASGLALLVALSLGWAGDAGAARRRAHRRGGKGKRVRAAAVLVTPPSAVVTVAPPAAPALGSSFGRVEFVTDKRAYLDRGVADGLVAGQSLAIARGGRAIGSCTVESVGDHEATCTGNRLRVGDSFRTGRAAARRVNATAKSTANRAKPVPTLAPIVDEKTLEARAAVVAEGVIDKVDFNGRRAFRAHSTAEVTPGFAAWFTQPDIRGGVYAQERIDGVIRGVPIGSTGLRFDGAFSAMRWSTPIALERFRSGTQTQFYLWEAEASSRPSKIDAEGGTTVAVGRLWPYHTPGLTLLDGVQLGRQNQDHTAEGGLYGGLIPSAASLAPGFDIWTAGLYGALTHLGDKQSAVRLAREEARIGVWRGPNTTVAEAEGQAQAWIGQVTAGGGGRLRYSPDAGGGLAIEHAQVDIGVRPSLTSGAGLHARYVGASLLPDAPLRAELPMTSGAFHALAEAHVDLSPRLGLGGNAGFHHEGATGQQQLHAGAEVRFSRLFGDAGGLWVGADVEQGWLQGEDLYVQLVAHPGERLQLLARLSGNGTRFETPSAIWNVQELGASASIDGILTTWLRVRAWTLLRAPILVQGTLPAGVTLGGVTGLSLAGAI